MKLANGSAELLLRKEFASLKMEPRAVVSETSESPIDRAMKQEGYILPQPHQIFISRLFGPESNLNRGLVKHDTGTGKTISSILTAIRYIKYYKREHEKQLMEMKRIAPTDTPLVFILGFTKSIFQREMLRRPEFGFITRPELVEYRRLKALADNGTAADQQAFQDMEIKLKRRFSKKSRGGFYKFMGYKELFNKLFIVRNEYDESKFAEHLAAGDINVNWELVTKFDRSFIICDEIHATYNSVEMNNYGLAIKFILDIYDDPNIIMPTLCDRDKKHLEKLVDEQHLHGTKCIFMSATPINNNPAEVLDLIHLLVPAAERKGITRDTLFDGRELKRGADQILAKLMAGRVSFLRDHNPLYYPERIIDGEPISAPSAARSATSPVIPYLRFIRTPMSKEHQKVYDEVVGPTDAVQIDSLAILDMIFPSPDGPIYTSRDISALAAASQEWRQKTGMIITKQDGVTIIGGEFLSLPELSKWSAKYAKMVELLHENLRNGGGKVLINHQYVHGSGALIIQEILRNNGFIDHLSSSSDNTLCVHCGIAQNVHKKAKTSGDAADVHEFEPARFITVHGEMDGGAIDKLIERYNNQDNIFGHKYRVMIGSKIINQGVDFNCVRELFVMTIPNNFPTLIQILGRADRQNSHVLLPADQRNVRVKIFTHSLSTGAAKHDSAPRPATTKHDAKLSYEENRYWDKSQDYLVIQKIEQIINESAIDAPLNRSRIFPEDKPMPAELGALYFPPDDRLKKWAKIGYPDAAEVDDTTHNIWYISEEIATIKLIIKRIFIDVGIAFTEDELYDLVRDPPFNINMNPRFISKNAFHIALHSMMYNPSRLSLTTAANSSKSSLTAAASPNSFISRYLDTNDNTIFMDQEYVLTTVLPVKSAKSNSSLIIRLPLKNIDIDASTSLGMNSVGTIGTPIIDYESWYRNETTTHKIRHDITRKLKLSNVNYDQMKKMFIKKYRDIPMAEMPTVTSLYDVDFHGQFLEDCIRYAFNILTNPTLSPSADHAFMFKMLYFYEKLQLLIFADVLPDRYKRYIVDTISVDDEKIRDEHKYNPFLMSSLYSSYGSSFHMERLDEFIANRGRSKIRGVFGNMLPIGHFLSKTARIYEPENDKEFGGQGSGELWSNTVEIHSKFSESGSRENDLIIGFYELAGIEMKFKTRAPVQKIVVHEDSRLLERGSSCETKKKDELIEIMKMLGIDATSKPKPSDATVKPKASVKDYCEIIRIELMRREMKERKNGTGIRWFYFHFEPQQSIV